MTKLTGVSISRMPTRSTFNQFFMPLFALVAAVVVSFAVIAGGQSEAYGAAIHERTHAAHRPVRRAAQAPGNQTVTSTSKADNKAERTAAHKKPGVKKKSKHKRKGKGTTALVSAKTSSAGSSTGAPGDPLSGDTFYVYPSDSAIQEENTLLSEGQTAEAAQISPIAREPEAVWLTSGGSQSVVSGVISASESSGTVPVFVVYDLPGRDCGSYSSGGASSPSDYESFIDSIVSALGDGKAVVIVEPDALSEVSCLSTSAQQTYYQLIGYAAQHLDQDANASVYVDAGNPGWQSASTEANELNQVLGSTRAGFAVNVSNFFSTATDISYGTQISQETGGRHFVIDTSRNGGDVASGQWCNPSGAGIGADPTSDTANPLVDAYLWIKDVGDSDGACNGGPSAGQFWLSDLLTLVAGG